MIARGKRRLAAQPALTVENDDFERDIRVQEKLCGGLPGKRGYPVSNIQPGCLRLVESTVNGISPGYMTRQVLGCSGVPCKLRHGIEIGPATRGMPVEHALIRTSLLAGNVFAILLEGGF